jgi:hypothetical protein
MYKFLKRFTIFLFIWMVFFSIIDKLKADDAFIYYKNSGSYNTSSQYTNLKSELEDLGFTVTGSTSGTVSSNDISNKDLVIDITGSSNCGSTCKTNYESYLSSGGKLLIVGSNGANTRNSNIEQLIEGKLSVGSFTLGGGCSTCYSSVAVGDYASTGSAGENVLPGTDKYMYSVSGGSAVANNSTSNSSIRMWHKWDYGSNGGSVYVTFGYGQFLSTHTYASNMNSMLARVLEEEGLLSLTPVSGITSNQTTEFNTFRNKSVSGNQIYITQTGDNNTLNIVQDGDDNLIIGTDLTSSAVINGDNNALDLDQIGNDNVLGLDVVGSSNNVAVTQNEDQRAKLSITGNSNNVDLDQSAINYVGEHYMSVIIAGNSNNVDIDQTETGNKKAFVDIDGSNNLALDQKGTGDHYAEITLTDNHSVDVTQDGSGDHNATINLSGNTSSVTLTQDSSTSQNYYLYQNCSQTSCSATVTQN